MVLRTLETLGPLHGYGLARRIEQTSGDVLQLNYGTLYPALLRLEQEGFIRSRWGVSENNLKAKYYELTKAGLRQVKKAAAEWEQTTAILARFLTLAGEGYGVPMRTLRAFCFRVLGFFSGRRAEDDFTAELESHVALH